MKLKVLIMLSLALSAVAAPLGWQDLQFKNETDNRRIEALLKVLPTLTDGFEHHPFQIAGSFMGEGWTKGRTDIVNENFMRTAGTAWYQLRSLNSKLPEAFGCLFSAGQNPEENGIGIRFWYCSGAKDLVKDGVDLSFSVWENGKLRSSLSILHPILDIPSHYEVEESKVSKDWREDLASLSSPESFKQVTKNKLEDIRKRFYRSLAEDKVWRLKYRQYKSDEVQSKDDHIPLTDEEASELRRYVHNQVEDQLAILEKYGEDMHQTFQKVVPLALLLDPDPG